MLTLRTEQSSAIWSSLVHEIEDRLVAYLRKYAPSHCQYLGESRLRHALRESIAAGQHYGFDTERALFFYVALEVMLGHEFVDDVQYPWARTFVSSGGSSSERARGLYDRAMQELDRFGGPDDTEYHGALLRAERLDPASLAASAGHDQRSLHALLQRLYPSKCRALGPSKLDGFLIANAASAQHLGLDSPHGRCIHVALAFFMGSGYHRDPHHPWASAAFSGPEGRFEGEVTTLHQAAREFIRQTVLPVTDKGEV